MSTRIYLVTDVETNKHRLIRAGIQAVRAVLSDYADVLEVLSARTMVRCHRLTEKRIHDIFEGRKRPHDVEITPELRRRLPAVASNELLAVFGEEHGDERKERK